MKNFFRKIKYWFLGLSWYQKTMLILGSIILVLAITLVSILASKFNQMDVVEIPKDEIIINQEVLEKDEEYNLGSGYTNFVIFGSDSRNRDVEANLNTDTIIIASLNNETKEVKLVSVYRDTLLNVGNDVVQKCNSAYARGGAKNSINMLNTNLDLNIQYYVTVDFSVLVDLVDMVGGIDVELSKAEMEAVNAYLDEPAKITGKPAKRLTGYGMQHLDGVQATSYARIRKGVGNDYARTERQRTIIVKLVEKIVKMDIGTVNNMIDTILPRVSTNMSMVDIMKYAKYLTKYEITDTTGFPFEKESGNVRGRGSSVWADDLSDNVVELQRFLFGIDSYVVSKTVETNEQLVKNVIALNRTSNTTNVLTEEFDENEYNPTVPEGDKINKPQTPSNNNDTSGTNNNNNNNNNNDNKNENVGGNNQNNDVQKPTEEKPSTPQKPENTDKPTEPSQPSKPEDSGETEEPVVPNIPGLPNIPSNPTEPSVPEDPTTQPSDGQNMSGEVE